MIILRVQPVFVSLTCVTFIYAYKSRLAVQVTRCKWLNCPIKKVENHLFIPLTIPINVEALREIIKYKVGYQQEKRKVEAANFEKSIIVVSTRTR